MKTFLLDTSALLTLRDNEPGADEVAALLRQARRFESMPLVCPHCGAEMRMIASITEAAPVQRILTPIGAPPRIAPARGPPAWDDPLVAAAPDGDALAQPEPEYVFDQHVPW